MIGIIGINHKSAEVALREKLSFSSEEASAFLAGIKADCGIEECVLLSTCNRLEIYFCAAKECIASVFHAIKARLEEFKKTEIYAPGRFYTYEGEAAARHLLETASGLDSMVLGENEILRQVKDAYRQAVQLKLTGPMLNRLFHKAFEAGKRVRSETCINQGSSSVGFAAVELVCAMFPEISGKNVLLVGAGVTGQHVLHCCRKRGCINLSVTNRTQSKLPEICAEFQARPLRFTEMEEYLPDFDIIIVSTGAPSPLITASMFERVMEKRSAPVFLLDLSVPRNVDERIAAIKGVSLYNIDHLEVAVDRNLESRKKETESACAIVEEILSDFTSWLSGMKLTPVIRLLKGKIDTMGRAELQSLLKATPDADFKIMSRFAEQLGNKYLGLIVKNLKCVTHNGRKQEYVEMLVNLFGLQPRHKIHEGSADS